MDIDRDQRASDREAIAKMAQAEAMGWQDSSVATLSATGFDTLSQDGGLLDNEREALAQATRRATTWRFDVLAG